MRLNRNDRSCNPKDFVGMIAVQCNMQLRYEVAASARSLNATSEHVSGVH